MQINNGTKQHTVHKNVMGGGQEGVYIGEIGEARNEQMECQVSVLQPWMEF